MGGAGGDAAWGLGPLDLNASPEVSWHLWLPLAGLQGHPSMLISPQMLMF